MDDYSQLVQWLHINTNYAHLFPVVCTRQRNKRSNRTDWCWSGKKPRIIGVVNAIAVCSATHIPTWKSSEMIINLIMLCNKWMYLEQMNFSIFNRLTYYMGGESVLHLEWLGQFYKKENFSSKFIICCYLYWKEYNPWRR